MGKAEEAEAAKEAAAQAALRLIDGKPSGSVYDVGIQKHALVLWCLLDDDGTVEKQMGLPAGTVNKWRTQQMPNGIDWYLFREELGVSSQSQMLQLMQPQSKMAMYEEFINQGLKWIQWVMACWQGQRLYDKEGKEVKHLYNEAGKRVPLGGIRPTTSTQVTDALTKMGAMVEDYSDKMDALVDDNQRRLQERRQILTWAIQRVHQMGGAAEAEKIASWLETAPVPQVAELIPRVSGITEVEGQ